MIYLLMFITVTVIFLGLFWNNTKKIMFILISVTVLALIFGAILGFASIKLKVEADPIVEKIDAILPQSNVGNAAILAVSLMLKQLLMVTLSQNACQVVVRR